MLDTIPLNEGEPDSPEDLRMRMSSRPGTEGCPTPAVEGGDPPAESREDCIEVEGSATKTFTPVQYDYNERHPQIPRSRSESDNERRSSNDGPYQMDQHTRRPVARYETTQSEQPPPRVYPHSHYTGYIPPYDSPGRMHSPYHYHYPRRLQHTREHLLRWELEDLKRIVAHQNTLLADKDSLLHRKDAEIADLKEAIGKANEGIDRAIKLKTTIKEKNKMIAEMQAHREELATENAELKSKMSEMSKQLQQSPEPPPPPPTKRTIDKWNLWKPEDLDFLSTFDFDSVKYCPDKPVYWVRDPSGLDDTWEIRTMCKNFRSGYCCKMGNKCWYGHSVRELQPFRINHYKELPCTLNFCNESSCNYRHGEQRRKLMSDFYLVYGGVLDAPRLCFYASTPVKEESFKEYLLEVVDKLERVLPKRLLPSQVVLPGTVFE